MIEWAWLIPTFVAGLVIGWIIGSELAYRDALEKADKAMGELTDIAIKEMRKMNR